MKKSLPPRPNLEHLRAQAKQLLSALRAGDAAAARTFIDHLPAAKAMTAARVRAANFRLADAQSAIARQSGFSAWPGLVSHVEQLRALEGEWHFASVQIDGMEAPAPPSASRLLIDGDRFRMESPDGDFDGVFSIDTEASPARIDVEFIEGPEAGNWSYGIFQLNGDELLMCIGVVGAQRPSRFATSAGSGHALERLTRASGARPANVTGGNRAKTPAPAAAAAAVDEAPFAPHTTPLLESLQGEWLPIALINDGKALAPALLTYGSRTMSGNETKVVFGGQVMLHARVRIDESTTPHPVDYLNVGRGARKVTHGIMDVADGRVRFCMAPAGAPRPAEFASPAGSGYLLSEWRRK